MLRGGKMWGRAVALWCCDSGRGSMWAYFLLSDFYSRDVVTDICVSVDMLKPICKRSPLLLVTLLSNKLLLSYVFIGAYRGFPHSSVGKESTCNAGDPGLIPGSGRFVGEGIGYPLQYSWASFVAQLVKSSPAMWETWVRSLGWEDPLEKGMATHSSILAWRIPWTV